MKTNKALKISLISIAFVMVFIIILSLDKLFNPTTTLGLFGNANKNRRDQETIIIDDKKYIPNGNLNILIIGIDNNGEIETEGSNGFNDFNMLVSISRDERTYTLVNFNRDTMCEIDNLVVGGVKSGTYNAQLAYAHTEGDGGNKSSRNVCNAISRILYGIDIDYYTTLNMDAIPILVESIGGVEITLEEDQDLSNICSTWVAGATILIDKDNCMDFIRSRMSAEDGTNLKRIRRQEQFIDAFIKKVRESEDTSDNLVNNVYGKISKHLVTDMSLNMIVDEFKVFKEYDYLGIKNITGTTTVVNNLMQFHANKNSIKEILKEVFLNEREDK